MKSTDGIYLGKLTVQISVKKKKKKETQGPNLFTKHSVSSAMDVHIEPPLSARPPLVQQIVGLEESSARHLSKFARYQQVESSGVGMPSVAESKSITDSGKKKPFFALGENGKKVVGVLVERAERLHREMVQSVMEEGFRPRTPEPNIR